MKKFIFALSMLPACALAEPPIDSIYTADPNNGPRGIVIVPSSKIANPPLVTANLMEQKTKGYVYTEKNNALAIMKDNKNIEINDINDPTDTHMKSDMSKIKLGFKFNPISFINPIGYAVGGTYIKDKGWTAIYSFFNDKELGSCSFKVNSMALSHGAVIIAKDTIEYLVNDKISSIYVEGSPKTGFVYTVTWDTNDYNYLLECANTKYDAAI